MRARTLRLGLIALCDGCALHYDPPTGIPRAAAAIRPAPLDDGEYLAPAKSKEPYKRAYTQADLVRLHALCGIRDLDDGDLTVDSLPAFWREFEGRRGKLHSARSHIETWLDHQWPADAPRYQRFIGTASVKDLVALDLDGQDNWLMWTKRYEGFSIFAKTLRDDYCQRPNTKH